MADSVQIRIKDQEARVHAGRLQEAERRSRMQPKVVISEPDAVQLAAARQLIERKNFSWDRIISDIEGYVPNDTRILSIKVGEVAASPEGVYATVEVKALGKTPAELTEMMTKMDASGGLFERRQASQEQATDSGEVPFTLVLAYRASRGGGQ
jgi:hypothetical protein